MLGRRRPLGGEPRLQEGSGAGGVDVLECAHGGRWHLGDGRRELRGPGQQLLVRSDLGYQADAQGERGVDHLARVRQPSAPAGPDERGQPRGEAATRQDADPGVRVGEHRPLGGDQEVTAEGQFEPAGEGRPVDGRDDRRGHPRGLRDARFGPVAREVGLAFERRLLEVDAGAEGRIGPGQHDGVDPRLCIGVQEGRVERADQLAVQRVARLGPVHPEHPHGARVLDEHAVGHEPATPELVWRSGTESTFGLQSTAC